MFTYLVKIKKEMIPAFLGEGNPRISKHLVEFNDEVFSIIGENTFLLGYNIAAHSCVIHNGRRAYTLDQICGDKFKMAAILDEDELERYFDVCKVKPYLTRGDARKARAASGGRVIDNKGHKDRWFVLPESLPKYELEKSKKNIEALNNTSYVGDLYRIRALRDFGDVKAGDIGGFVSSGDVLSHDGKCWIYDDAVVVESSVKDNATVCGNAVVVNSQLAQSASVRGDAIVKDTRMGGRTKIADHANVRFCSMMGRAAIINLARVSGVETHRTQLYGNCVIAGNADMSSCEVKGRSIVSSGGWYYSNVYADDHLNPPAQSRFHHADIAYNSDWMAITNVKNIKGEKQTITAYRNVDGKLSRSINGAHTDSAIIFSKWLSKQFSSEQIKAIIDITK